MENNTANNISITITVEGKEYTQGCLSPEVTLPVLQYQLDRMLKIISNDILADRAVEESTDGVA